MPVPAFQVPAVVFTPEKKTLHGEVVAAHERLRRPPASFLAQHRRSPRRCTTTAQPRMSR